MKILTKEEAEILKNYDFIILDKNGYRCKVDDCKTLLQESFLGKKIGKETKYINKWVCEWMTKKYWKKQLKMIRQYNVF